MKTFLAHQTRFRAIFRSRHGRGFTILELMVVVGLIGLMTFIAVPAFKGFGQSNKLIAAQRQIGDDVGLARQYAIKNRTPVYMVFFAPYNPDNVATQSTPFPKVMVNNHQAWLTKLSQSQGSQTNVPYLALRTFTNLYAGLNASYAFYTDQTLGDQPGVQRKHYLSFSGNIWKTLPDGIIFAPFMEPKISLNNTATNLAMLDVPFPIADQIAGLVPATYPWPTVRLPVLVFDGQGRLAEIDQTTGAINPSAKRNDRYLALGLGTTILPRQRVFDVAGSGVRRQATDFDFSGSVDVLETPKSNYTNSFYHVLALTGRLRKQPWPLY